MNAFEPAHLLRRVLQLGVEMARLPLAQLHFDMQLEPVHIGETHAYFTRPHARFGLIKNKTLGIALVDLRHFNATHDYLATVKRKDHAAYHAKRARARGYTVREIDRNYHVDDIHAINTALASRQGRPMDPAYLERTARFEDMPHYRYFGVLDRHGRLVAYCNLGVFGNFAATDQLLGIKNNDGIMYLLLLEIICRLIEEKQLDYLMYDTYLGAQRGLRSFKQRIGFRPFRVRYSIE